MASIPDYFVAPACVRKQAAPMMFMRLPTGTNISVRYTYKVLLARTIII